MKELILIFIIGQVFFSCSKIDTSPTVGYLAYEDDFSCLEDWVVNINSNNVNIYDYIQTAFITTYEISYRFHVNYLCDWCDSLVWLDVNPSYLSGMASAGYPLTTYMHSSYTDLFTVTPIIQDPSMMCYSSSSVIKDTILNNLHHFVDSLYMNQSEADFIGDFIVDVYNGTSNINLCDYKDRWDTLTLRSLGNGLFSAIVINSVAGFAINRPDYIDHFDLEPDTYLIWFAKVLRLAGAVWVSAMWSIHDKGCEGLQDPGAGNMILSDAGRSASYSL